MIKSVWNGTLAGQFCCLKKKKKEKEKPSCSFVDCPNVWGSCTCETESYFSLHSSPSPFSTTHFLSLSFSLQLFHHPLSLSLRDTKTRKEKEGWICRTGFKLCPIFYWNFWIGTFISSIKPGLIFYCYCWIHCSLISSTLR